MNHVIKTARTFPVLAVFFFSHPFSRFVFRFDTRLFLCYFGLSYAVSTQ